MTELMPIRLPVGVDDATAAWLAELARQAMPPNTLRAMRSAVRYWSAWHLARFGSPLDLSAGVTVGVALTFVADHGAVETPQGAGSALPVQVDEALVANGAKRSPGPPAYQTWHQRLSLLARACKLLKAPNGCSAPEVLELVRMAKRPAEKLNLLGGRKPVILREVLAAMIATCDGSPAGIRDRALLLFAFASGGRRRSEIAAARLEDLEAVDHDGEAGYVYRLSGAKGQDAGRVRFKPIRGSAARAMDEWLRLLNQHGSKRGPLFRAVRGGIHGAWIGEAGLSGHAVNAIVQRRAKVAGLPPGFTAHGLRGGFLTQAYRDGVDLYAAMALSDHRDVKTVREHYLEDVEAMQNPAGRLMG